MNIDIIIKKLTDIEDELILYKAAHVFVEAYYQDLKMLSDKKEKLIDMFVNSFNVNYLYAAFIDDKPVGIMAISDKHGRATKIRKQLLRRVFGFVLASRVFPLMYKEMCLPMTKDDNVGNIECVGVLPSMQGKGVATALIEYAIQNGGFEIYTLDVYSDNLTAFNIYKKQGFEITKIVPSKNPEIDGYESKMYMQYNHR